MGVGPESWKQPTYILDNVLCRQIITPKAYPAQGHANRQPGRRKDAVGAHALKVGKVPTQGTSKTSHLPGQTPHASPDDANLLHHIRRCPSRANLKDCAANARHTDLIGCVSDGDEVRDHLTSERKDSEVQQGQGEGGKECRVLKVERKRLDGEDVVEGPLQKTSGSHAWLALGLLLIDSG